MDMIDHDNHKEIIALGDQYDDHDHHNKFLGDQEDHDDHMNFGVVHKDQKEILDLGHNKNHLDGGHKGNLVHHDDHMDFVAGDTEDFLQNHDHKERSAAVHDDDRKNNDHDHHMEEILDDHIEMLLHIDGEYFGLNVCLTVTDGPCKILHSTDKYGSTLQMSKIMIEARKSLCVSLSVLKDLTNR